VKAAVECEGCCQGVKAAVKMLRLLSRREAAVEVFKAAVEMSRLLLRCDAAVKVLRPLSRCQGCTDLIALYSLTL
jgi:hypothetical protein